jgi:hypothetical protein
MQRRFSRVLRRLRSESFAFVIRNAARWPPLRRSVAQAVLLRGMTQREAAGHLGLTVHAVRKELDRIAALRELHASNPGTRSVSRRRRMPTNDVDDADALEQSSSDGEE